MKPEDQHTSCGGGRRRVKRGEGVEREWREGEWREYEGECMKEGDEVGGDEERSLHVCMQTHHTSRKSLTDDYT